MQSESPSSQRKRAADIAAELYELERSSDSVVNVLQYNHYQYLISYAHYIEIHFTK